MDIGKLFGVLVVGGSLLAGGAGCDDADDTGPPDAADPIASGRDGGEAEAPDGAVSASVDAGEALEECGFCPNEICCEYDEEGVGHTKEGFVCCWSTAC